MDAKRFVLTINLGNEAMQTWSDIAGSLRSLADRIEDLRITEIVEGGRIYDLNGNRVGSWHTDGGE